MKYEIPMAEAKHLYEVEGWTFTEIAKHFDVPAPVMRNRLIYQPRERKRNCTHKLTDEQRARLMKLLPVMPDAMILKDLNYPISRQRLDQIRKKSKIPNPMPHAVCSSIVSEEKLAQMIALAKQNKYLDEIAKESGVMKDTVQRCFNKLGIPYKLARHRKRPLASKNRRKYKDEDLISLYNDGVPWKYIKEILGISTRAVCLGLRRLKIPLRQDNAFYEKIRKPKVTIEDKNPY